MPPRTATNIPPTPSASTNGRSSAASGGSGYECRIGTEGEPIRPTDYLPRRLMGEYLAWFYDTLLADAPATWRSSATSPRPSTSSPKLGGREAVLLDNGETLSVDHVVLTSGHTFNEEPVGDPASVRYLRPYPVEYFDAAPPGLIGGHRRHGPGRFDLMTALTVGRGGAFESSASRKRYVGSGNEPVIYLYSRSGVPYCAKSAHGVDPYGDYRPVVCTPEAFAELTHPGALRVRRQVDFRTELLPLLFAEMQARYHTHAAYLKGGVEESAAAAGPPSGGLGGWQLRAKPSSELELLYGHFDPASHDLRRCRSPLHLEQRLPVPGLRDDRGRPRRSTGRGGQPGQGGPGSPPDPPRPFALGHRVRRPVPRVLHRLPVQRAGPDQPAGGGPSAAALPAAPRPSSTPAWCGSTFGPDPEVTPLGDGRVVLRSTQLDRGHRVAVNGVVRGHLDLPSLARSGSPLLSRLYAKGRLTQLSYGDTAVGSVAISEDFHPYDAEGRLQPNLSLLGVLTEGVRYFTHYLPSPRSRLRAVLDAQDCVEAIIG